MLHFNQYKLATEKNKNLTKHQRQIRDQKENN